MKKNCLTYHDFDFKPRIFKLSPPEADFLKFISVSIIFQVA